MSRATVSRDGRYVVLCTRSMDDTLANHSLVVWDTVTKQGRETSVNGHIDHEAGLVCTRDRIIFMLKPWKPAFISGPGVDTPQEVMLPATYSTLWTSDYALKDLHEIQLPGRHKEPPSASRLSQVDHDSRLMQFDLSSYGVGGESGLYILDATAETFARTTFTRNGLSNRGSYIYLSEDAPPKIMEVMPSHNEPEIMDVSNISDYGGEKRAITTLSQRFGRNIFSYGISPNRRYFLVQDWTPSDMRVLAIDVTTGEILPLFAFRKDDYKQPRFIGYIHRSKADDITSSTQQLLGPK